jgi:hypothetical protein
LRWFFVCEGKFEIEKIFSSLEEYCLYTAKFGKKGLKGKFTKYSFQFFG